MVGDQCDGFNQRVVAIEAMPRGEEKRERSGRDACGGAVLDKMTSPAAFQSADRHL